MVFCAGQIPLDPKSGQIVAGDIGAQTRRVMDNITAVLKADGLTFEQHREDDDFPRRSKRLPSRE